MNSDVGGNILARLDERNTTVLNIYGVYSYESREHGKRIRGLLELNRHCRDACTNRSRVQIGNDAEEFPIDPNANPVPIESNANPVPLEN